MRPSTWTKPRGMRSVGVGLLMLPTFALLSADEPPTAKDTGKPPWQRLLTGADAKQAERLQQRIDALYADGKFAEAVPPAEQLARLRERLQGADHWETADVRRRGHSSFLVRSDE